jgi:hypothetical protein
MPQYAIASCGSSFAACFERIDRLGVIEGVDKLESLVEKLLGFGLLVETDD